MTERNDLQEMLIEAAMARRDEAVLKGFATQYKWIMAVDALKAHRGRIYVATSGPKIGTVVGLPDIKVIGEQVHQRLLNVVRGVEPKLMPHHIGQPNNLDTRHGPVVTKRIYRDCAFAILAALWLQYQGPGQNGQTEDAVRAVAKDHCHDRQSMVKGPNNFGWNSKKTLVNHGLIHQWTLPGSRKQYYSLTVEGAKTAHQLFNVKFHPSRNAEYKLIQPLHGTVTEDGVFYPHGAIIPLPPQPQLVGSIGSSGTSAHNSHASTSLATTLPNSQANNDPLHTAPNHDGVNEWEDYSHLLYEDGQGELTDPEDDFSKEYEDFHWLESRNDYDQEYTFSSSFSPLETDHHCLLPKSVDDAQDQCAALPISSQFTEEVVDLTDSQPLNEEPPWPINIHHQIASQSMRGEDYLNCRPTEEVIDLCDSEEQAPSLLLHQLDYYDNDNSNHSHFSAKRRRLNNDITLNSPHSSPLKVTSPTPGRSILERMREKKAALHSSTPSYPSDTTRPTMLSSPIRPGTNDLISSQVYRSKAAALFDLTVDEDHPNVAINGADSSSDAAYCTKLTFGTTFTLTNERVDVYDQSKALSTSMQSLRLFVDTNERRTNSFYREFFLDIHRNVSERVNVQSHEVRLVMGDFMFAFVTDDLRHDESNINVDSESDDEDCLEVDTDIVTSQSNGKKRQRESVPPAAYERGKRWVAEVAIERKCISDIMRRSAGAIDKQQHYDSTGKMKWRHGPHFRQEKHLRNSMLQFPCFLIEGDLAREAKEEKHVPLIPEDKKGSVTWREDYLSRSLDVIEDQQALLQYVCGIWTRNYGERRVYPLHTASPSETGELLAAFALVLGDKFSKGNSPSTSYLPEFGSFQHYWNGKVRNNRQRVGYARLNDSTNTLSTEMEIRLKRRFGSEIVRTLSYLNDLHANSDSDKVCETVRKSLILADVSLSSTNNRSEVLQHDRKYILDQRMVRADLETLYKVCFNRPHDTLVSMDSLSWSHEIIVNHNHLALKKLFNDSMSAFTGDSVNKEHSHLVPAITVTQYNVESDTETGGTQTQTVSRPNSNASSAWCELVKKRTTSIETQTICHRSSSLFILLLSGMDVMEHLSESIDEINAVHHRLPLSATVEAKRQRDLLYIRRTWDKLIANTNLFPNLLKQKIQDEEQRGRHPQVIVLLENLGHGPQTGVCCKVMNYLNKVHNAEIKGEVIDDLKFAKSRKKAVSREAAKELESKVTWMINLFTTVGLIEYHLQCFHCNDTSMIASRIVSSLVKEMEKNSLIAYH